MDGYIVKKTRTINGGSGYGELTSSACLWTLYQFIMCAIIMVRSNSKSLHCYKQLFQHACLSNTSTLTHWGYQWSSTHIQFTTYHNFQLIVCTEKLWTRNLHDFLTFDLHIPSVISLLNVAVHCIDIIGRSLLNSWNNEINYLDFTLYR